MLRKLLLALTVALVTLGVAGAALGGIAGAAAPPPTLSAAPQGAPDYSLPARVHLR